MSVAILVPSLNRPQRLRDVVGNIHATTDVPHQILFCVADPESKTILDELGAWYLDDSDTDDRRYVTRMNKLIWHIGDAETVFFGSDDVVHRHGWYQDARAVMEKGADVVVVNDLRNPNGTQALVRASYLPLAVVDDPTVAFHPGYLHNFADTEMFYTAWRRHTYNRALTSIVEHLHPIFGGLKAMPWDSTYVDASKGWDHDEALYRERVRLIERLLP